MDRLNAARDVHMPASDAVPAKSAVREPSGLACSSLPLGAWMRASREEKGGVAAALICVSLRVKENRLAEPWRGEEGGGERREKGQVGTPRE